MSRGEVSGKCLVTVVATLVAAALSGCATPRWSKQWTALEQSMVSEAKSSPGLSARTMNVQAYGLNGFRFGAAGGNAIVDLPSTSIGWDSSAFRIVAVRLAGASDGLEGLVLTDLAGRSFLLAKMSRLTVREWKEQPLMLETVSPSGYLLVLPSNGMAFDLDLGRDVEVSSGATAYRCVAAQARELANAEMIRAGKDMNRGRINGKQLEYVQEKVVGMLASSGPTCR